MMNWSALTLFLYIAMRLSGFVLFNPLLGRSGIPSLFQAGLIAVMSAAVSYTYGGTVPVPETLLELSLHLILELGLGFLAGMVMRLFFYIGEQAGETIDTQMGLSMARTYDPGAQSSMTVFANLFHALMILVFFAANGHITLLRIMLTSGELVPFGSAMLGQAAASRAVELFAQCALLAVKMALPILGAELLGQVGMGVMMKAIPQISIFAINIELKVFVGLIMLLTLLSPVSDYLLEAENQMLAELRLALTLAGG